MKFYVYNLLGELVNVKIIPQFKGNGKNLYFHKHGQYYFSRLFTRQNAKRAIMSSRDCLPELPDNGLLISCDFLIQEGSKERTDYLNKTFEYLCQATSRERFLCLNRLFTQLENEKNCVKFFQLVQYIHGYKIERKVNTYA